MNGLEILVLVVVLVGGPLLVRNWWRAWHRQYEAARHTYHAAQQDVQEATVFYGSMTLPPHSHNELDWRERTMAELSPEALDLTRACCDSGWGGEHLPSCPNNDSGLGGLSSLPPGPDPEPFPPMGWPVEDVIGPSSLEPVWERLADTGDITQAHTSHPHPGEDWLDTQLAELFAWVRTQWDAA